MIELKVTDHAELTVNGTGEEVLKDIMVAFNALTRAAMNAVKVKDHKTAFKALSEFYLESEFSRSSRYNETTIDLSAINKYRKDKE